MDWVTNNPEAAKKLRAADRAYEKARKSIAEQSVPLSEKIEAYRRARTVRDNAYERVVP